MAEFHLWSKETLVDFAEKATTELAEKDARIATLEEEKQVLRDSWRKLLHGPVPSGTIPA